MLCLILFIAAIAFVSGFQLLKCPAGRIGLAMMCDSKIASKATIMLKKKKIQEVNALKAEMATAGEAHPVNAWLINKQRPFLVDDPVDIIKCAFGHKLGCLSVLAEYNKKNKNTGFIIGMPPPEIMGGILRDSGARGIVVSMDKRSGGTSLEEFRKFTVEQSRATKLMPKPIPVIWHDFIVDNVQIATAAAYGAAAITLHFAFTDDMEGAVQYSRDNGVVPIVCVESIKEAETALDAGANVICFEKMTEDELVEARLALPSSAKSPDLKIIARLRPEGSFTAYAEIDQAWRMRDNDFHGVWPSPDAVYATGISDIYPTVLAMRAKTARKFMSPRQFLMDRKKEGAEEFLGDILY